MKRLFVLLLGVLLTATARAEDKAPAPTVPAPDLLAPKAAAHKPDDVVARVGKTEIKWKEVQQATDAYKQQFMMRRRQPFPEAQTDQLNYSVVDELVSRELILQQGKGHEPADLDTKVKTEIENAKTQVGGEEGLSKALAQEGMTMVDYTQRVREGLVIQETLKKALEEKTKISDDDCKKFYEENRSKFLMPEQVRASHILIRLPYGATDEVKTQKLEQAKAALTLVKNGEPFAAVAKKYSEDPGSAQEGGDLNYFSKGRMVPEFEEAAFSLKTNEVSNIVTSQFGYHIIKVIDRKPAGERAYADAKSDIERYLKTMKGQEAAMQYVEDLRSKAKVEILLPKPEMAPQSMMMPPSHGAKPAQPVETAPVAAPKP